MIAIHFLFFFSITTLQLQSSLLLRAWQKMGIKKNWHLLIWPTLNRLSINAAFLLLEGKINQLSGTQHIRHWKYHTNISHNLPKIPQVLEFFRHTSTDHFKWYRDIPIPSKGAQHHTEHSWALLNWLFQSKLGFTWPWRPQGNFLLWLLSPGKGLHLLVVHPVPVSSLLLTSNTPSLQKGSHTVKAD